MSTLQWKLRRLRAMGPGEIMLRGRRAVRDRLLHPKYLREKPLETYERLFRRETGSTLNLPDVTSLAHLSGPVIAEADSILSGRIRLFGREIQLDNPPTWNRNYFHGGDWPKVPAVQLDYHQTDVAGGVKYTWEPSRHAFLLRLAQAAFLTGEAKYADACESLLLDWIIRNPAGFGIHWTSPLEMAVRMFVWGWILSLLRPFEPRRTVIGSMAQQAAFIADNLSFGSSANNHLVGEAAGLLWFASLFPECALSTRWKRLAKQILEHEIARQIHPDGVPAEQAFGYLPFVWEFYLFTYGLMAQHGEPTPPVVTDRLTKSVEFVRTVMDKNGHVPQVGDEDDGEVVPLYAGPHNRYCSVGRAVSSMVGCEPPPRMHEQDDAYSLWFQRETPPAGSLIQTSRLFPQGGYAVMSAAEPDALALLDFGPLGLGTLAAHGHDDALAFCLSVDGRPIFVDAGTYAYHEDEEQREYFRSAAAHNTVTFAGANRSEIMGPFLWGNRAVAKLERWESQPGLDYAEASLETASGEAIRRTVAFVHPNLILISDRLTGARDPIASFNLSPECALQTDKDALLWRVENGPVKLQLVAARFPDYSRGGSNLVTPALSREWYSPRFGQRVECQRLVYPLTPLENGGAWLVIGIQLRDELLKATDYGFEFDDLQVVLADAGPWRGRALFVAARMRSGLPAVIVGVDVGEISFDGRALGC